MLLWIAGPRGMLVTEARRVGMASWATQAWSGAALLALGMIAVGGSGCLVGDIGSAGDGGDAATTSAGGSGASGGSDASGGSTSSGGAGGSMTGECVVASDCAGIDGACQQRSCSDGVCGMQQAAAGTSCDEQGGALCDGAGVCVECLVESDCSDGICQANQCVPAACGDGVQNGDESAIDCGGSCAPCANGVQCNGAADCVSGFCNAGTCAPCGNDGQCGANGYCNAGSCAPKKVGGDVCGAANQCQSGFCPADDGVCCNSACNGTCRACVAGKTGGTTGTCDDVSAGQDFEAECGDQGAASCGANGMGCNGNGACNVYASGTQCAAPSCSGGQETAASQCNGNGSCVAGGSSACAPYLCSGNSCSSSCGNSNDCASGYECQSNVCTQPMCGGAGPATTPLDSQEQAFLVLINNHRANNGLGALTPCTSLNRAAQGHSEDMRDNDYFSHTGTGNTDFIDRSCAACYDHACPLATSMAENIAAGNSGAQGTFTQWLNSPGHNANMLGASYTRIGIGRATGGGTYGSYWTNVFGGANEASCN
jgi:uncharacterized protein YkwD